MSTPAQEVNNAPLINVTAATASEICARLYLDKAVLGLLRPAMGPREFVNALVKEQQYLAAIDFIAHALPSREAIWWGCLPAAHLRRQAGALGKKSVQNHGSMGAPA